VVPSRRAPHGTYLFVGPDGIGKRTIADALTARLLCTRRPPTTPAYVRALLANRERVHPECASSPATRTPDIRIEQTRELCKWLALRPLMAERKGRSSTAPTI